jgi:hypothetical protein
MAPADPLSRIIRLYHFTDTRNLPSIRKTEGLYSTVKLREMGVEFHAGGNEWSLDADKKFGMDRYVHLCFKPNHPMEHLATKEGRITKSTFLRVDPAVMYLPGAQYSPGVSNKSDIELCSIEDAKAKIDFEVLYSYMDWNQPDVQARRLAAEKCEILIPDHVLMKYLEKYFPDG